MRTKIPTQKPKWEITKTIPNKICGLSGYNSICYMTGRNPLSLAQFAFLNSYVSVFTKLTKTFYWTFDQTESESLPDRSNFYLTGPFSA